MVMLNGMGGIERMLRPFGYPIYFPSPVTKFWADSARITATHRVLMAAVKTTFTEGLWASFTKCL